MLCDYCLKSLDNQGTVTVSVPKLAVFEAIIPEAIYEYHYDCWVRILVFAESGRKEKP